VVQALGAGQVEAHVVRRPAHAELVAARGQLADEVLQTTVVGIAPGVRAQVRDQFAGQPIPVGVEVDRGRVQEGEPSAVGGLLATLEDGGVQGAAERVGGQVVAVVAADDRGRDDLVEDPLHERPDALLVRMRR
jgi:hypothetical protein